MSYVMADALQRAVYTTMSADGMLMSLVDGAVYDALPKGPVPPIYVTLGAERVRDQSDISARGAIHDFVVTVQSDLPGFLAAKQAAARVSDILDGADLALDRGRLVRLDFLKAAARQRAQRREVEIWFRAFVEDVAAA
ncbi:DUF3168 domain-containing protein [Rhodobacterales bacterium HKCCE2091]|nr:DUF3168 domain-containing protein [Rhodobacterales bacterium HKCCE2091]